MTAVTDAGPTHRPSSTYPVGWLDRLADRVEGLPGPAWCYYLTAWAVLLVLGGIIAQRDLAGTPRFGEIVRYYALWTGLLSYVFLLRHSLRRSARVALDGFRPVYREDDRFSGQVRTLADSLFQLTNAPALPSLMWSVVAMGMVGSLMALGVAPFQRLGIAASPFSFAFNAALELALWATFGAGAYSLLHTLRLVSHLYTRHARISLFELQPLYAFSALMVRYALGVLVAPLVFFALQPGLLSGWSSAAIAVVTVVGAFTMFVAPLTGAHQLLAADKSVLLGENSRRLRETLERLHKSADDGEGGNPNSIQSLLLGLQQERTILETTPTWPWRPGLFRAFLSALLLPLVIWLIQFLLARLLER